MKKVEILSKLEAAGVIAVVRGKNKDEAIKAINSIIAGGIKGIELTFTVPNAEEIIKEIAKNMLIKRCNNRSRYGFRCVYCSYRNYGWGRIYR